MRIFKKEVLIIFVLAVLVTVLLWFSSKVSLLSWKDWIGFFSFYALIIFIIFLILWIILKNLKKSPEIIAFWFFSYGILLIIWLNTVGFRLSEGNVLPIFLSTLIVFYSPLYLLSFFSIKKLKDRKYSLYIRPIIYSFLLFIPHHLIFYLSQCQRGLFDSPAIRCDIVGPIWYWPIIIQIISCLVLASIYYFKKENILPKLVKISLVFLIILGIYLAVFYVRAYQMPDVAENLTKKAVETKNISFCDEIRREGKKRGAIIWESYRKCIETLAIATNDESLCSYMLKDDYDNLIEIQIYKSWLGSSERWERLDFEIAFCRQTVFLAISGLCRDIDDKAGKMECIKNIAVENNDIELCKKLETNPYGYDCIASLVLKNNNPALCFGEEINSKLIYYTDEVFPEWFFGKCFEKLFLRTDNPEICEKVSLGDYYSNENVKAYCYRAAALKLNDSQLCERISSMWESMTRRDCFKQFEK